MVKARWFSTWIRSLCAGALIGLGCTVSMACDSNVVGAFLFSLGLLSILVLGFDLYTGRICTPPDGSLSEYVKRMGLILLGNLCGVNFIAVLVSCAWPQMCDAAAAIVAAKLCRPEPLIDEFLRGVMCELYIALAVRGYVKLGKNAVVVVMCVMAFILTGSEHCVADMFYMLCGRMFDLPFLLSIVFGNTCGGFLVWVVRYADNRGED